MALVPPQTDLPRQVTVDFARELEGDTYELGFAEVTDETQAHGLAGCHCLIRRSDIHEDLYESEPATWVGWVVRDERGDEIGEVDELIDNPGQSLLAVRRKSAKTAYIPVVDEFIIDVDVDNRIITVSLPCGLLDL